MNCAMQTRISNKVDGPLASAVVVSCRAAVTDGADRSPRAARPRRGPGRGLAALTTEAPAWVGGHVRARRRTATTRLARSEGFVSGSPTLVDVHGGSVRATRCRYKRGVYPGTSNPTQNAVARRPLRPRNGNHHRRLRRQRRAAPSRARRLPEARRAALQPADVGLPGGGRRRTPGLRREEVAQLAGVGTTWYTWLEQGRDVRASVQVLESLPRAAHDLGRAPPHHARARRAAAAAEARKESCHPRCGARREPRRESRVRARTPLGLPGLEPAYVRVFGDLDTVPPAARNALWLMFTDPRAGDAARLGRQRRRLIARFRADHARHVGDPCFEDLVDALLKSSADFRRWWPRHEVPGSGEGRKTIVHPTSGELEFEHALFKHGDSPDQRLVLYSPDAGRRIPGAARAAAAGGSARGRAQTRPGDRAGLSRSAGRDCSDAAGART